MRKSQIVKEVKSLHYHKLLKAASAVGIRTFGQTRTQLEDQLIAARSVDIKPGPQVNPNSQRQLRMARRQNVLTHGVNATLNDDLDLSLFNVGIMLKGNFSPDVKQQIYQLAQQGV